MRIQIFYAHGLAEKWTNVYHASGSGILDIFNGVVDTMVDALLGQLDPSCSIKKFIVSDTASDDFSEGVVNQDGVHSGSGSLLPLFNSVKVFFPPAGFGRPDYKFIKGLVGEDNSGGQQLSGGAQGDLKTMFDTLISDLAADGVLLCSENGDEWTVSSVQGPIQMRQMHRRRKKVTPP